MSDRILFLDIDGVILPTRMWAAAENFGLLGVEPAVRAPRIAFDPGAIGLLVQVAGRCGAKLVLHSNWRRRWPGEAVGLLDRLVRSGLPREYWHPAWTVPVFEGCDKGREISAWLREHGAGMPRCLIVDDQAIGAIRVPAPLKIAQVRPLKDDGFGLREYRAALSFFGVGDSRARGEAVAEIQPVAVSVEEGDPRIRVPGHPDPG